MDAVVQIQVHEAVASRMYSNHLSVRLEAAKSVEAYAACALRSPSVGFSDVSAAARTGCEDNTSQQFLQGSLMASLSVRGEIHVFPVRDILVFTKALIPETQDELLHVLGTEAAKLLQILDLDAEVLVEMVIGSCRGTLAHGPLAMRQFGKQLAEAVGLQLSSANQELWLWPSEHVPGQSVGERFCKSCIPLLALMAVVCVWFKPGGQGVVCDLVERCCPAAELHVPSAGIREPDVPAASELVRRYLRCFGPALPVDFAAWAGIAESQANRMWSRISAELQEVSCNGRSGWMLYDDALQAHTYPWPEGVRLLPWYDPYLEQPQRGMLVEGKNLQSYFYQPTPGGAAGMVLFDGNCAGGWRMAVERGNLNITLEDIGLGLGRIADVELEDEIRHVAASLGLGYTGFSIVSRIL